MKNKLFYAMLLIFPAIISAHAFPDHANPRVGDTVSPTTSIQIWFDCPIEPKFSQFQVINSEGKRVDKEDAKVNKSDDTLIEATTSELTPGIYTVKWSVAARDGHKTEGDYTFTVR